MKVKRLAWAGHLVHMNNDKTLKKILNTNPDGVRSVGRLKLWWEDGVDQVIRILGVKNWKEVALDRDEWAQLLKKARAHQRLSRQWWWVLFFFCIIIYFVKSLINLPTTMLLLLLILMMMMMMMILQISGLVVLLLGVATHTVLFWSLTVWCTTLIIRLSKILCHLYKVQFF